MVHLNRIVALLICFISSMLEAQVRCPTVVRILPCQCTEDTFGGGGTTQLRCYRLNMEDQTINDVLDVYLTTPLLSPLSRLDAFRKRLTKIPEQLPRFPRLNSVQLHRNDIHHIPSGAFNFNSDLFILNLSFNELTTIESGAFQGNYRRNGSVIWLYNNNLTRFESGVFQPVLEQMAILGYPNAYIDISNNPIDCNCHLAWLIRENSNLMSSVYGGQCADGRTFDQLDPLSICDEPTTTSTTTQPTTVSRATWPPTEAATTTTTALSTTTESSGSVRHHISCNAFIISYHIILLITSSSFLYNYNII